MLEEQTYLVRPIGRVSSPLTGPGTGPKQHDLEAVDGPPIVDVKPVLSRYD
jgi:tRNA (Thr-GGU) A37 N-methylase